jgi:preprotein translocase subunit SecE
VANTKRAKQSGDVNPVVRYFRETRGELRKVTWPTREEAWRLTLIVLGVTAAMAIFLGVILDAAFSNAVQFIIRQVVGA